MTECTPTAGRLGLGPLGLEGDALGSSALLARDRDNQLFLGLGRRRVRAEMAHGTSDCLGFGDGRDYLVDGSCLRWRQLERACRTLRTLLVRARMRAHTASERISSRGSLAEPGLRRQRRERVPRELLPQCYRSISRYSLALVCSTGKYPCRNGCPRTSRVVVDVDEEGYPYLVRFELLFLQSRSPLALTRSWRR